MSREAMQLALWALEGWDNHDNWVWPESALEQAKRNTIEAITALRQALEEEREPLYWSVATGWVYDDDTSQQPVKLSNKFACKPTEGNWVEPLYTAPPKQWVGLTDEDIAKVIHGNVEDGNMFPYQFAKAIEAKLKERNHG